MFSLRYYLLDKHRGWGEVIRCPLGLEYSRRVGTEFELGTARGAVARTEFER